MLFSVLAEDGYGAMGGIPGQANLGDYVMSESTSNRLSRKTDSPRWVRSDSRAVDARRWTSGTIARLGSRHTGSAQVDIR